MLQVTCDAIAPRDEAALEAAFTRQQRLTKPTGALAMLEELSIALAGMTARPDPIFAKRAIVLAAASHAIADEGVSAYPASVTAQMVLNFLGGGAAINVLADQAGAELVVVDAGVYPALAPHPRLQQLGLVKGARNWAHEPALEPAAARALVEAGIAQAQALADAGVTLIALGEMGIGNTTAAAALTSAFLMCDPELVTGRGTQISERQLLTKITLIRDALARYGCSPADPLATLAAVGGAEIAFLTGCCLGAASRRVPVLLDGFITTAAALVAVALAPLAVQYLIAGHCSAEPGHERALEYLGLRPLLRLGMRLGEGSGAALAMPIVVSAARLLNEMATFGEAGVDDKA